MLGLNKLLWKIYGSHDPSVYTRQACKHLHLEPHPCGILMLVLLLWTGSVFISLYLTNDRTHTQRLTHFTSSFSPSHMRAQTHCKDKTVAQSAHIIRLVLWVKLHVVIIVLSCIICNINPILHKHLNAQHRACVTVTWVTNIRVCVCARASGCVCSRACVWERQRGIFVPQGSFSDNISCNGDNSKAIIHSPAIIPERCFIH